MERDFKVNNLQAEEIMMNAGFKPVSCYVTREHRYNHIFCIRYNQFNFFAKAHTKLFYTDEQILAGIPVKHELNAYKILAEKGLKTPRIVASTTDSENPIQYPYILTQRLEGENLFDALKRVERKEFNLILLQVGEYVRKMHDITFFQNGYGIIDGDKESLFTGRSWDINERKREALAMLEAEKGNISKNIYLGLREKFTLMDSDLSREYNKHAFVHGNLDLDKMFVRKHGGDWSVVALLDMEMACAGDPIDDIVNFAIGMSNEFPESFWWEPFFKGYGKEADFQQFKLRLLGYSEKQLGWHIGFRDEVLSAIFAAVHWRYLFRIPQQKFEKREVMPEDNF